MTTCNAASTQLDRLAQMLPVLLSSQRVAGRVGLCVASAGVYLLVEMRWFVNRSDNVV
jgi:hypothetical protein